ncbi:methyl-accepting chemotaxis protein [Noviherbaspirillum denitrificans]|uniref:Chemotaxis protein n=1 Tax=Noviherbaspirillum denitrificans TaxID=1968433 RepID=A0A254TJP7_9BURK|nr:methyl-accepting chemotaxis protein [Noviherbaspirillum denitrificans]OWW21542.1 chemotaxis protein [Noviherbaspirillum denitrificans]
MKIKDMKIGVRMGTGFFLMLALMMVLAATGGTGMSRVNTILDDVIESNVRKMNLVQTMSESVHIVARVSHSMVMLNDNAQIENEYAKIVKARSDYDTAITALSAISTEDAEKAILAKLKDAQEKIRPINNKVFELAKAGKDAEATELLLTQAAPATQHWQDILHESIRLQEENNKFDQRESKSTYESARLLMFILTAVAIASGLFIALTTTRGITQPLREAMKVAKGVAEGDLTQRIIVDRKDETGELLASLKEMNESLARIVAQVRTGTDTIASASSQIASGNLDLSSRTEEQASSLEETASSMEELTSTVKQNADNALQANQLAKSASGVAVKGGTIVSQVVETMGEINNSARKISDIIGVIDGIAFQTNILALNAAVEAARAGEQGRGFAVVASEVRNLAQRSAAAAKEIKALISDSVEKVDVGARLVDQAGETMNEIVASVKRVTDIMDEINAASREQAAGIGQVNDAITQMDQVTQQNAALVEEASAAAEALKEQADGLAQTVSVFKLDSTQPSTVTSAARPTVVSHPAPAKPRVQAPLRAASSVRMVANARAATASDWEEF